jgi:hypothetical protein
MRIGRVTAIPTIQALGEDASVAEISVTAAHDFTVHDQASDTSSLEVLYRG